MSEDANKLLNLYELDPTSFNLELRIKLGTMKQLKRIADKLDDWTIDQALEVKVTE